MPDDLVQRLRGGVYGVDRIPLCAEAAAEIERLRADARRLDWIEANPNALIGAISAPDGGPSIEWVALPAGSMPVSVPYFKALREAIDAAIAADAGRAGEKP